MILCISAGVGAVEHLNDAAQDIPRQGLGSTGLGTHDFKGLIIIYKNLLDRASGAA